jgi:hypothetical protein
MALRMAALGAQPGVIVAGDEAHPAQTASDQIVGKKPETVRDFV